MFNFILNIQCRVFDGNDEFLGLEFRNLPSKQSGEDYEIMQLFAILGGLSKSKTSSFIWKVP